MVVRRSCRLDWPGFGTLLPAPPILNSGRDRGIPYHSRCRVNVVVRRVRSYISIGQVHADYFPLAIYFIRARNIIPLYVQGSASNQRTGSLVAVALSPV